VASLNFSQPFELLGELLRKPQKKVQWEPPLALALAISLNATWKELHKAQAQELLLVA
jgi:hypothetical protein